MLPSQDLKADDLISNISNSEMISDSRMDERYAAIRASIKNGTLDSCVDEDTKCRNGSTLAAIAARYLLD